MKEKKNFMRFFFYPSLTISLDKDVHELNILSWSLMLSTLLFYEFLINYEVCMRVESLLTYLMREAKFSFWLLKLQIIFCCDDLSSLIDLIRLSTFSLLCTNNH